MNKLQEMLSNFPEESFLIADGFDEAILGFQESDKRVIYSVKKCIEVLMREGMTEEDAIGHFYYNVSGSYVGELTPIWCFDNY